MEAVSSEPVAEPSIQSQIPPISKSESVLDPTDLSDTTESEAEKHGCKYIETNRAYS